MPIRLDFYLALAIVAGILLAATILAGRTGSASEARSQRAALHFTLPLLLALAVLLPPFEWVPPVAGLPIIYFWQIGLLIGIVGLARALLRGRGLPDSLPQRGVILLAAFYILALLASLVYPEGVLVLVSVAALAQLFRGWAHLLAAPVGTMSDGR